MQVLGGINHCYCERPGCESDQRVKPESWSDPAAMRGVGNLLSKVGIASPPQDRRSEVIKGSNYPMIGADGEVGLAPSTSIRGRGVPRPYSRLENASDHQRQGVCAGGQYRYRSDHSCAVSFVESFACRRAEVFWDVCEFGSAGCAGGVAEGEYSVCA